MLRCARLLWRVGLDFGVVEVDSGKEYDERSKGGWAKLKFN